MCIEVLHLEWWRFLILVKMGIPGTVEQDIGAVENWCSSPPPVWCTVPNPRVWIWSEMQPVTRGCWLLVFVFWSDDVWGQFYSEREMASLMTVFNVPPSSS